MSTRKLHKRTVAGNSLLGALSSRHLTSLALFPLLFPTMRKQKQQTISRFFYPVTAAKPETPSPSSSHQNPTSPHSPIPKVTTTVSFSPSATASKRALSKTLTPLTKKPRLSPLRCRKSLEADLDCPSSPSVHLKTQLSNLKYTPLEQQVVELRSTTTVSFSPSSTVSKRALSKTLTSPTKKPRLSPLHCLKSLESGLDRPPSTSLPPKTQPSNLKFTPLEQQVVELRSRYPDVLLMIEVGYKYRFFGKDAEVAARVLGIFAHMDRNFLTASIPTFRLNVHVRRLVAAGYKVGVVKQTETAAIKAHGSNRMGPFSRELSALYTRSTICVAEELEGGGEEFGGDESSNYLLCVVEKGMDVKNREHGGMEGSSDVKIGIVAVEISSGDVIHGEFIDSVMRSGLESVVLSLSPTEILLASPLSTLTEKFLLEYAGPSSNVRVERTSRDFPNGRGALAEVISVYESINDYTPKLDSSCEAREGLQEDNHFQIKAITALPELAIQALALTIGYLKRFGFERILCFGASFRTLNASFEMKLSPNALQQLEIVRNKSDGSLEGSLLQVMDHTSTSFGSRLLKHWVTHPLCDRTSISARLEAVSEIAESLGSSRASNQVIDVDDGPFCNVHVQIEISLLLSSVLRTLAKMPDVHRGIARIFHQTATPMEVIAVIRAILHAGKQLQQLQLEDDAVDGETICRPVRSSLLRRLISTAASSTVISNAAVLLSCLNKDAAEKRDMSNLFNPSNSEFPMITQGRADILALQKQLDLLIFEYRKKLRIHNLEFFSVSGTTHLIELPSDVKVPSTWIMINSTKKTIRYHPPEVVKYLDELAVAKEELAIASKAAWRSFLNGFGKYYAQFQAVVQALAALDCLYSLAILSRNKDYVRPTFVDDVEPSQIEIISGRHPVLESILHENFVPNDCRLHALGEHIQIVTGPNMGGKSSYIRQVALIAIMAQVGSFVPASSAKLHILDGIYTRIGASDNIQQGRSTFLEELSEASDILHQCSSRSLVIMDELGRGTSTHDGVAVAYATLQYLLEQKKCSVLFVTHYPKIMDILHKFAGSVGAYHVSYITSQNALPITNLEYDTSNDNLTQNDITFLYKVAPGISDKSFGLNVAGLAQLPSSCIERAAVMAAELENEMIKRSERRVVQERETVRHMLPSEVHARKYVSTPASSCHRSGYLCEFARSLRRLLLLLQFAVNDAKPADALCCLKDARELALSLIEKGPLIA